MSDIVTIVLQWNVIHTLGGNYWQFLRGVNFTDLSDFIVCEIFIPKFFFNQKYIP